LGLTDVEWMFDLAPAGRELPARLNLAAEVASTLELRRSPVADVDVLSKPGAALLRLTGPYLPLYCVSRGTQEGKVLFSGSSLVVLIIRPSEDSLDSESADGVEFGLMRRVRMAAARTLAASEDLFPHTDGFEEVDGFIENPPGHLDAILREIFESTMSPDDGTPARTTRPFLFYPSGDPVLRCLAERIKTRLSNHLRMRISGVPSSSLHANLRDGTFDMMLMSLPAMGWTRWESAGISLAHLAPHLWDPIRQAGGEAWVEEWLRLPVNASQAEAVARRLERSLLETATILPLGQMETRVVLVDPAGDAALPPPVPLWVLDSLEGP